MFVRWGACIPITCPVDIGGMQGIIHMVKRWNNVTTMEMEVDLLTIVNEQAQWSSTGRR